MLPNELLWVDGEFWKWQKDDDCHGLYCQKYPLPYIERLLDQIEKWADQKEAKKLIVDFDAEKLAYRPFNEMQLDARTAKRKSRRGFPPRLWQDELPFEKHLPEAPYESWWRKLRSMTITYRVRIENILGENIDHPMQEEIEKGEWD